ncbi:MAG: glucoamylase family protein, partial [Anaerolineales bacterium]
FYAFDYQLNYQYQSFGVPELGLRRDQGNNLVIAPYATFLALHVDPPAAWDNLQRLAREGAAGPYGYFEALDYTPARRPRGQAVAVVASFMAHHQGMSLLALDNYLNGGPMPRRFHSEASIAAVELLLQERVPRHVPVLEPNPEADADPASEGRPLDGERSASVRWFATPHTPTPRTHVLSNSSYEVMVTNAGGGYSHYNDPVSGRTVAVTRWRPDSTLDNWGTFIYLQDTASGQTWSATFQPTAREPEGYEASYSVDRVEFRRRDLGIESHLEIVVSPRDNIEIRRVTLTNRSRRPRALALTSFAELVLDTPEADLAHPAFGKLFVESEYLDERHALLFQRRPRAAGQPHPWALHLVTADRPFAGPVEYETDRARFLGRGQTARRPAALRGPLSNTIGAVLDPVMSLRATLKLAPAESATVVFVTGVGADREAVLALADKYHDPRIVESTQELACVYSQIQLRHLNITDEEAHLYQRLASRMLYPDPGLRAPAEILLQNRRGQSALWAYGLSGDNPILLVELDEDGELDLARQLLRAHEYWRLNNFVVDLVILNEHATSYAEGLEGQLRALINTSLSHPYLDRPGGVFVRRADQMPVEDQVLLKTVAQAVLDADAGTLLEQMDRSVRESAAAAPVAAPQRLELAAAAPAAPSTGAARQFDNGMGGFSADGREYVIRLAGEEWTPMPWANVLANESFGCLVSEAGLGCTWSENSQQNRLTPWSNDPVRDPAGEAIYLRDEATGETWTPTPLPMRAADGAAYTIAHGAGYTRYEHIRHDLVQELLVFVPPADSVKVMRLRLRSLSRQARQVSITGYAEWVLGVHRAQTQHFVITERDSHSGALLARNRYNTPFAERVAFAHLSAPGPERRVQRGGKAPVPDRRVRRGGKAPATLAYTTDRTEFIGRNRSLAQPAGLDGGALSGRVGAGLDPCAALQTTVTINPRETVELIFLVGQAADAQQAGALIARYSEAAQVEQALQANHALWDDLLGAVQVHTPDPALDLMLNRWLLYQATVCRLWGRTAFYQSGGAYGFRDQLQDVLALLHARPDLARAHLLRAAARQFVEGDVQHWWHPTTGQGVRTRFSDDFLWLPYAVTTYVAVTGDAAVLDEPVPYLQAPPLGPDEHEAFVSAATTTEKGSLYEHCTRALDHGLRFGAHGLPLMGIGDWNDGMNRVGEKGQGESVWLGWFLLANLQSLAALARQRGDTAAAERYELAHPPLALALEEHGWDGQWYRRAYFDDGTPLGSAQNEECQIDSIAQSWAVISGGAPADHASQALDSADERLVLPEAKISRLLTPPFNRSQPDPGYIQGYIAGTRENGGQYTHAALWLVLAHAMQGNAERAAELYAMANPINHALTAEDAARYKVEPYVVAADIYAHPQHLGRGGWTWYTGSAAWMYRVGLEGLLGLRRRGASLSFEPCLPKDWPGFELTYRYGKTRYEIQVENGVGGKVTVLELDGRKLTGVELALVDDGRPHTVRVKLGEAA